MEEGIVLLSGRAYYVPYMNTSYLAVYMSTFSVLPPWAKALAAILLVWFLLAMILKCYAMWQAGMRKQKWWFIALFFVQTLGLFEILYLFLHRNRFRSSDAPSSFS